MIQGSQHIKFIAPTTKTVLICTILAFVVAGATRAQLPARFNIEKLAPGTRGVDSLIKWSDELGRDNQKSAMEFAEMALKQSRSERYAEGEAGALYAIGNVHFLHSAYDDAVPVMSKSLKMWEVLNNRVEQANCLNILAVSYNKLGDPAKSLESFNQGIELVVDLPDASILPTLYNNMGSVYRRLGNYSEAIWLSSQSLKIREQSGDRMGQANARLNLGILYESIGHWEKARFEAQASYEIFKELDSRPRMAKALNNMGNAYLHMDSLDRAHECYLESYELKQESGDEDALVGAWLNLAEVNAKKGNYGEAQNYYSKTLILATKIDREYQQAEAHLGLGDMALVMGDKQKAVEHYEIGHKIAEKVSAVLALEQLRKKLGDLYTSLNKPENANYYYKQLNNLRDTLKENTGNTIFMADQLVNERNRSLIKEQENLKMAAEFKQQRILLMGITITAVLLILTVYLIQRNRRQAQLRVIAEKETVIVRSDINRLLKDQELVSLNRALEAQEGERKRIARDLHDRLGSMLAMVKLHFQHTQESAAKVNGNGGANNDYTTACRLLDEACEEVRSIAHNLVSGVLKNFGLPAALNELKTTLNDSGKMKVELIAIGMEKRLKREAEDAIYHIIQELVANTMRHANANEMTIQLLRKDQNLNLMVEDNGRGFNMEKFGKGDGIGYQNIRARLAKMNGKLEIDSGMGSGTTITLNIPLHELVTDTGYSS